MDAEFTALMLRLMASDNVVREQAERMYDEAVRTQAAMVRVPGVCARMPWLG